MPPWCPASVTSSLPVVTSHTSATLRPSVAVTTRVPSRDHAIRFVKFLTSSERKRSPVRTSQISAVPRLCFGSFHARSPLVVASFVPSGLNTAFITQSFGATVTSRRPPLSQMRAVPS
jgi:hypothetical protein